MRKYSIISVNFSILAIIISLILLSTNTFAQYQKAYNMAKQQEKHEKYYEAILSYTAAQMSPDAPANNDVNARINFCAKQLMQQRDFEKNCNF